MPKFDQDSIKPDPYRSALFWQIRSALRQNSVFGSVLQTMWIRIIDSEDTVGNKKPALFQVD
jgi:hypothetical protein